MNREILFKAKRVDNGEWVEGYYWQNEVGNHFIRVTTLNGEYVLRDYEVVPETVGEFTGLTDKNGKRIFEGDIVKQIPIRKYDMPTLLATDVIFASGMWGVVARFPSGVTCSYIKDNKVFKALREYYYRDKNNITETITGIEIIGNLHDNPELLEVEK